MTTSEIYNPNSLLLGTSQTADDLFQKAFAQAQIARIWAKITGKPNTLMDVKQLTNGKKPGSCRYLGHREVSIGKIIASEGRCEDFDREFRPRNRQNQERWMRLAFAFTLGIALPAVDLIKIGDKYIVRDGHHRISVMKALGGACIDANVTEWKI
jgi:hypothetical protein